MVIVPIGRVVLAARCCIPNNSCSRGIPALIRPHITVVVNPACRIVAGNAERHRSAEIGADVHSHQRADAEMARPVIRVLGNSDEGAGIRFPVNFRLGRGHWHNTHETTGQARDIFNIQRHSHRTSSDFRRLPVGCWTLDVNVGYFSLASGILEHAIKAHGGIGRRARRRGRAVINPLHFDSPAPRWTAAPSWRWRTKHCRCKPRCKSGW